MKRIKTKGIVRGSVMALSLALLISNVEISAFAATSNELREFLGIQPNIYKDEIRIDFDDIDNEYKSIFNLDDSLIISDEDREYESIIIENKLNNSIKQLEETLNKKKAEIDYRIENQFTAYQIVDSIENMLETQINYNKENELLLNYNSYAHDNNKDYNKNSDYFNSLITSDKKTDVTIEYYKQQYEQEIYSLDFNIGTIGKGAISPVKKYLVLETPYGFTKSTKDDAYKSSKLLGIDLYARQGDAIVSQWNGIVVSIEKDESGTFQTIKIYHGNSTYTTYNHIIAADGIKVGVSVNQGQLIGYCEDTTGYEPDKQNHMFYQISLNGEYINPLLIYGTSGKTLYENWITSHTNNNVIEEGEKYYNDNEDNNINGNESREPERVPDIKFHDFNINEEDRVLYDIGLE